MYRKFYGLRDHPFGLAADVRFLYPTPAMVEAYAALWFAIARRSGFAVLAGEVGTGKTMLLRLLMKNLESRRWPFCFLFNPTLQPTEFLEYVLVDLGIECVDGTKGQLLVRLNEYLLERYRSGATTTLIIDEAHLLSDAVMEEVRLLTNLEGGGQKLLQVVLSGQPELDTRLAQSGLRQLRQRVYAHVVLPPLSSEQTGNYILRRLATAGGNCRPVFTPEGMEAVHNFSGGIPRVINLLCDHALIQGYVKGIRPVGPEIIQELAAEFGLSASDSKDAYQTSATPEES